MWHNAQWSSIYFMYTVMFNHETSCSIESIDINFEISCSNIVITYMCKYNVKPRWIRVSVPAFTDSLDKDTIDIYMRFGPRLNDIVTQYNCNNVLKSAAEMYMINQ